MERLVKGVTSFGVIGADDSTVERVYGHHRKIEQERKSA